MNADQSETVIAMVSIVGRDPIEMTGHLTLGRDPKSDAGDVVAIDGDPLVSKSHLAIDVDDGLPVITDLGSANGTYLHHSGGETPVPSDTWIPIPTGAEIEFGDQRMTIVPVVDVPTVESGADAVAPGVAPASGSSTSTCQHCQQEIPPGSKFCDHCGTPTASATSGSAGSADEWAPSAVQPAPPVPTFADAGVAPGGAPVAGPDAGPVGPPPPSAFQPGPPAAPFDPAGPAGAGAGAGPVFVDQSASPSSSGGAGKKIAAVVAVVVVLALVGFGLTRVLGGGDSSSSSGQALSTAPDSIDEEWSQTVDGEAQNSAVDGDAVYVTSVDTTDVSVSALARADGDEVWNVTLDASGSVAGIDGLVGDTLLVEACDAECVVTGVDVANGDERWDESLDGGSVTVIDDHVFVVNDTTVALYDPANGDRLERVDADNVQFGPDHVIVGDSGDVEVFDLDLVSILGPESLDDDTDAVAFDGSRLIVATGDDLSFTDRDGDVVLETTVDVGLIDTIRPISNDNIILGSDEGVVSIDPVERDAVERWSTRLDLDQVADVDGGSVVITNSTGTYEVFDADSGDSRFASDLDDASFSFPTRNALVVYRFSDTDSSTEVGAYDWKTGDELWSDRFDGQLSVQDGIAVEVGADGDVIVYR